MSLFELLWLCLGSKSQDLLVDVSIIYDIRRQINLLTVSCILVSFSEADVVG